MLWMLMCVVLALPPLDESQRLRLSDVSDGAAVETGGLHALLEDAWSWVPGDVEGAMPRTPEYPAIYERSDELRGEVFVVRGVLQQVSRRPLARGGAWGDAVTQWAVLVRRATAEEAEEVVLVLLPDAEGAYGPGSGWVPGRDVEVEVVARFYKVLTLPLQGGEGDARFQAFVGRYPARVGAVGVAVGGGGGGAAVLLPMMGVVALASAAFWFVVRLKRKSVGRSAVGAGAGRVAERGRPEEDTEPEREDLPTDPAEALAALEREG